MEEIDNGVLAEAATSVAALVAQGMFSGVRQPGGILAAAITNAPREKRVPPKVPGPDGVPPPEAGADTTAGNVLSPRMQALNALQARFERFEAGQAAPRAIDFGAAAAGNGAPPPAKLSLAGLAILRPSAEAPWEMDCKVQLLKNLGGITIVRKINGAATGKMLDEKDPLVDLDAAGKAAAAHGCDIDFDIVYKRAQAIYAIERPHGPPLCFDAPPKTWAEAILRLHLILRIHSGGEGSTNGNGAFSQATLQGGKPPVGSSIALEVVSAEAGAKQSEARSRAVSQTVAEPIASISVIWAMLATQPILNDAILESKRLIALQGTPQAVHSLRAYYISNAKVLSKLAGEIPAQFNAGRSSWLATIKSALQTVVGAVNAANDEISVADNATAIMTLDMNFKLLVKHFGAIKAQLQWSVGRESQAKLHGRWGTIEGDNAAGDIKRAAGHINTAMLYIMCDILGEPRPADEDFGFDALADATAVLTADTNVEGVWNNLFSLVSIGAREFRVNATAAPPPLAMYLREAATTVSTQLSYIEAAEQAGARGAAAQRGGGATTGADAEGRRAKRQARFEELKEKKKKKQASAKQQGPNATAAVAPVAGAPAGAAPTPATLATASVKLVALKRSDLVAGSITRLLDRKG